MEILKLYEKAASELDNAISSCKESDVNISSITLILSDKGTIYTGLNWKRLNDSLSVEETCSEYEAVIKLLLAGESVIDTIITLNAKTKLPVNPCTACQELIIKINPENKSCKVVSGKNSQVILTSLNNTYNLNEKAPDVSDQKSDKQEISKNKKSSNNNQKASVDNETVSDEVKKDAQIVPENNPTDDNKTTSAIISDKPAESSGVSETKDPILKTDDQAPVTDDSSDNSNGENKPDSNNMDIRIVDYDEPENEKDEVSHSSVIDTAGLKMIFDDWETEKSSETSDNLNIQSNKPFNVNSLSAQQLSNTPSASENKTDAIDQQPVNSGVMYQQQPVNNMYQQHSPVNNVIYQQQASNNNIYQQQPVNNMYQQQPVNNMYQQQQPVNNGLYQQQPVNNGLYQQQQPVNNGLYQQQQPVNNGLYQQQQPVNNGMYQQQPVNNSMYQQQQPANNTMYPQMQAPVTPNRVAANNSLYINQQPQTQANNSLYMNQIPQQTNTQFTNTNYQNTNNNTTANSTYINKMQAPITNVHPNNQVSSQSVYGTNINSGDNNAIFKDRLNNILTNSTSISSHTEEEPPIEEAMKSIKDKKKAAKIDAKFIKRQKKNGNL